MAKVLIVDDSAYARKVHRAVLERAGHNVVEAATGNGAIEQYSLEQPDAVVLDLSMEDLSGLDVLRTLRQLAVDARIVVVSADVQRSTEAAVMEAGAAQFVPKPANPTDLVAAVQSALGRAHT